MWSHGPDSSTLPLPPGAEINHTDAFQAKRITFRMTNTDNAFRRLYNSIDSSAMYKSAFHISRRVVGFRGLHIKTRVYIRGAKEGDDKKIYIACF